MKLQTFVVFTPIWVRWEDFQLDLRMFFGWVVQPPTRYVLCLWPNSNQNQGSCGGFKLFTAINLLGKTEIQLVKMKLNLRPAIDSTSNLFKQNPSCRPCKKKSHCFFQQVSQPLAVKHDNYKIKRSKTKCQKRPVF